MVRSMFSAYVDPYFCRSPIGHAPLVSEIAGGGRACPTAPFADTCACGSRSPRLRTQRFVETLDARSRRARAQHTVEVVHEVPPPLNHVRGRISPCAAGRPPTTDASWSTSTSACDRGRASLSGEPAVRVQYICGGQVRLIDTALGNRSSPCPSRSSRARGAAPCLNAFILELPGSPRLSV